MTQSAAPGRLSPCGESGLKSMSEDKKNYGPQLKYMANNIRRFQLAINRNTEPDLLAHLESQPNLQGYLKTLIRADMEKRTEK